MKSAFFRQMLTSALILFLTLLLLGGILRLTFENYLEEEKEEDLHQIAQTVTRLTHAYGASGKLDNNWDFHMSLSLAAQVSETDVILCDENGQVTICACQDMACEHLYKTLSTGDLARLRSRGEEYFVGRLDGLYPERRYVHMVVDDYGVIVISAPVKIVLGITHGLFILFFYTALVVWALAFCLTFLYSRHQARPLREMTRTVRRFGHGDLNARARVYKRSSQELAELAGAFNNMADTLQRSEQQRQDFVANVSHELKTPITSIAGYLDGMLDGTIPPEEQGRYMQVVSQEVKRMSRLVRSMLEVSRMQAEGVQEKSLRRFDLAEAATQAILAFEPKIRTKNIEVELDLPEKAAWTVAHEDGILQVLHNLLDNAVKFCNDKGQLTVCLRPEGGKYRLSVKNTGAVIPREELPLIFDRFHKLDRSRAKDPDGVGLGLYIVKTILGAHGENIWVESHDCFTTFTFTLPVAK